MADKINGAKRGRDGVFEPNLDLTDKELEAIRLMVYDEECDTNPKVAEKLGIARSTLWKWTQREEFVEQLQKERKRKVSQLGTLALRQLEKLMVQDDDKRTQLAALKIILQDASVDIGNSDKQSNKNPSNNFNIVITADNVDVDAEVTEE